jgi:tetratricopeptide (TPR) repeat protein
VLRWVAIAILALLVCGGVVTLSAYAGFEWWRVKSIPDGVVATPEPAAVDPTAPEAVLASAGPAVRSPSCDEGSAAFTSKDYERATTQLGVCLELYPDRADLRMLRGRAWASLGRYERAEVDLEAALGTLPDDQAGWEALVYSQVRGDADRAALATIAAWLERNPTAPAAFRMRADVRYRLGELGLARDDAARACALGDADGCTLETRMKDAGRRR